MAGETLPPVVLPVEGDISDLVVKVSLAKRQVESFDGTEGTAKLSVDSTVGADVAAASAAVAAFGKETATAQIGATGAAQVVAEVAAANLAMASLGAGIGAGGGGGGGGSGLPAAALAAAAASRGGGGQGGGGGLLSTLGWGGGLFGMAGFGSILSLAGFGAEHLLTTGIGLAGSLGGAALGGGLLALGAGGVAAVGMGTDMAGIGQALGDSRALFTALTAVQQAQLQYNAAVAAYGPNSQAALMAQQNLQAATANYTATLQGFPAAARTAVAALTQQFNTFHTLFNNATGQAEATGANILNQIVQVGEKFLPELGAAAAKNMGIIQTSLQPFFGWLSTQGLGIFTNLENVFTQNLPTGIHALTQGFELLARTINLIASKGNLGGFTRAIDSFLTRLNGADWSGWSSGVMKLIGIFRVWMGLAVILFKDLWDLFKLTAGVGTAIAQQLTLMLQGLHNYLNSGVGIETLTGLFRAHVTEIKAIFKVLEAAGPGLLTFATIYMQVATAFTTVAAGIADFVSWVLKIPGVGYFLGLAGAIALIAKQAKLLVITSGVVAAFRSIALASSAISAAFSLGGFRAGLSALASFFGGGNWGSLFGKTSASATVSANTSALAANTAALEANTAAKGGGIVPGVPTGTGTGIPATVGGASPSLASGLPGQAGLEVGGLSLGALAASDIVIAGGLILVPAVLLPALLSTVAKTGSQSPVALKSTNAAVQSAQGYAAAWAALQDSQNAMYAKSNLFNQNLLGDLESAGLSASQASGIMAQIKTLYAQHKISSATQLQNIVQGLLNISGSTAYANTQASGIGSSLYDAGTHADQVNGAIAAWVQSVVGISGDLLIDQQALWNLGTKVNTIVKTLVGNYVRGPEGQWMPAPPNTGSSASGGTWAPGQASFVGENAMELAYALPGGGMQIFPLGGGGGGSRGMPGSSVMVAPVYHNQIYANGLNVEQAQQVVYAAIAQHDTEIEQRTRQAMGY